VTFATLVEIEQWLNIIYTKEAHPTQMLVLEDVLECKDAVTWKRARRPDDWGTYSTHCAVYNEALQVFFQRPAQTPLRVYDYARRHPIDELDSYPEEEYGTVDVRSTVVEGGRCRMVVEADADYQNYPVAIWDVPDSVHPVLTPRVMVSGDCAVLLVNLKKGVNGLDVSLSGE